MNGDSETLPYFQWAYDFFNGELFDGKLPRVKIVFGQDADHLAYYHPDSQTVVINPDMFDDFAPKQIFAVLVHEQTHVWQTAFGHPTKNHHNAEWHRKIAEFDLGDHPGATFIVEGGKYERAFRKFLASNVDWRLRAQRELEKRWRY